MNKYNLPKSVRHLKRDENVRRPYANSKHKNHRIKSLWGNNVKKNAELVKKESEKLKQEIIDNGYSEDIAQQISGDLSSKGGYCFNKSHSFCYAVLCAQTAFFKAKYPVYFFKALFNLNKHDAGKLNKYILDAKNFGIEILPPSINHSEVDFSVYNGKVIFGLSAIAGIGEMIAEEIVKERQNGKFKTFGDFLERVHPNTAQVVNLTKAGAFPTKNKREFLEKFFSTDGKERVFNPVKTLPPYKALSEKYGIDIERYRTGSKKYDYDKPALLEIYNRIKLEEFQKESEESNESRSGKYAKYFDNEPLWEYEALRVFIKDNPFEKAMEFITKTWDDTELGERCVIVGVISNVQKKKDRNKRSFAFINIYSTFGIVEGVLWSSQYAKFQELIKRGTQIAAICKKDGDDKAIIEDIKPYGEWAKNRGINGNL